MTKVEINLLANLDNIGPWQPCLFYRLDAPHSTKNLESKSHAEVEKERVKYHTSS